MKKGDRVEFILFSERVFGEIHRVNRKDKTFDIIVEGIIYPNAEVYKKGGLNPYTTARNLLFLQKTQYLRKISYIYHR